MNENPSSPTSIFTGSVPENYDTYLGPIYFEPYAIDIARRFDPSKVEVALEIGCGTGRVTNHLRRVLPASARLIASDISPDMMAVARRKFEGEDIEWQIFDAQSVPLPDSSVDLVVSCFAFMFIEDKAKAFAEAYRVLTPGGKFVLALWDTLESNGASDAFRSVVKKYFDEALPKTYGLPFAFNDPVEVHNYLRTAGFSDINIQHVKKEVRSLTAKDVALGLTKGASFYNEIIKKDPALVDTIMEYTENELIKRYGDAPMIAPMSAVVCEGLRA